MSLRAEAASDDFGGSPRLIATLHGSIDAGNAKAGQPFELKALGSWNGLGCRLQKGATIYGHITSRQKGSRASRVSRLGLSIDAAECNGAGRSDISLIVYALFAPDDTVPENMHSVLPREIGRGGGLSGLSSVTDDSSLAEAPNYSQMHSGEVRGFSNTTLTPAATTGAPSLLVNTHGNIHLNPGTVFVLAEGAVAIQLVPERH